jgi:tetratricopeptide (TPR) repeat protein
MCKQISAVILFLAVVALTCVGHAQDLTVLRELAERGAWNEAHAVCRQMSDAARSDGKHSPSELRQLQLLDAALYEVSSQHSQYGTAWERLGRYDKAIQYYDEEISKDKANIWPMAHTGGLTAARQGDWAKVIYYHRLLEQHGETWIAEEGKARADLAERYRQDPDHVDRLVELATKFWVASMPALGTDYQEALSCLSRALDLTQDKRKRSQILEQILDYARRSNDVATMKKWAERVASGTEPDENLVAVSTLNLGNEAYMRNDLEEAKRQFLQVVQELTNSTAWPDAVLKLGQCYQKEKAFKRAIATYQLLLDEPTNKLALTANLLLIYRNCQYAACAGISACNESRLEFTKALAFHTETHTSFLMETDCGTCLRSIQQRYRERESLLRRLITAATRGDKAVLQASMQYYRRTGMLPRAIAMRFPKQIGRQLFLEFADSNEDEEKIEIRAILQVTGLSGVTNADWSHLFSTSSRKTQFGAVTLLSGTQPLSEELASLLVVQFMIEVEKGESELSSAISHVLTSTGGAACNELLKQLEHPSDKVRESVRDACRDIRDVSLHHDVVTALLKGIPRLPRNEQRQCASLIGGFKHCPEDAPQLAEVLLRDKGSLGNTEALPVLRRYLDRLCDSKTMQSVDWKRTLQLTPLMVASKCGDFVQIEKLVTSDHVNAVDYNGDTALYSRDPRFEARPQRSRGRVDSRRCAG